MNRFTVIICKCLGIASKILRLGNGTTWSGEIALKLQPTILHDLAKQIRKGIILVAGTNGKTTTALMISKIIAADKQKVIFNSSGANLLNGVVGSMIQSSNWLGSTNTDWAVFEVDENSLPGIISNIQYSITNNKKLIVVLLNLFRDQLDRYGEVDVIVEKWQKTLAKLPHESTVILNSDDPAIAYLGKTLQNKVIYFGIENEKYYLANKEHATDSLFCLQCGRRLIYKGIYYSHIGQWECVCGNKKPKPIKINYVSPLPGIYNIYNTYAAVTVAQDLLIHTNSIKNALSTIEPAFGRQEEFVYAGKKIKIFLSKNPVGFNQSLKTIIDLGAKNILILLNDRIPDGRDVSWIWDVDFDMVPQDTHITVSGDRAYDMAIRMKYAMKQCNNETMQQLSIVEDLKKAVKSALDYMDNNETLYILPTYSAMLEVRKIITGHKIL